MFLWIVIRVIAFAAFASQTHSVFHSLMLYLPRTSVVHLVLPRTDSTRLSLSRLPCECHTTLTRLSSSTPSSITVSVSVSSLQWFSV